jgi:hypothetical protein
MLNSKDKIIQVLKDHFNGLGIDMEINNKKLVIRDGLLNFNIIVHIVIAVLAIKLTYNLQEHLYLLPIVCLYSIIAYTIFWVDYKSINIIEFDLLNRYVNITNRSFVRRWVFKYITPQLSKYYFEEIRGVSTGKSATIFPPAKYFVNIKIKNHQDVQLISFSEELNSLLFSEFIMKLID